MKEITLFDFLCATFLLFPLSSAILERLRFSCHELSRWLRVRYTETYWKRATKISFYQKKTAEIEGILMKIRFLDFY